MKLIKIFHQLKREFLTKLPSNDTYQRSLVFIAVLVLLAAAIWIGGPYLIWKGYAPLLQPEKRVYVILFLFLIWLLKLLLIDLDKPSPFQHKDPQIRKKILELQHRFYGALKFLKKTTVSKHGKSLRLNQLPQYLLIGPPNAGKTALLVSSDVNFLLHKRFQNQDRDRIHLATSENCDWWVTRDTNIIDVPGKYLSRLHSDKNQKPFYPLLWQFLLRLIKKQHGKNGISGIIIALPLAEMMKQNDLKKYQSVLSDLFQRMQELTKIFQHPIPCHLVITKCDLLPGFSEFFADSSDDEIMQVWGVTLNEPRERENIFEIFTDRFDTLIKKLNEQLIWRLHQERNPMTRPYIKDFPLQVEQLKKFTLDFIKKLSAAHLNLSLQSTYLTSALQVSPEPESNIIDDINTTQRAVQLFKEPSSRTRAYFIKQLITHALVPHHVERKFSPSSSVWTRRIAYTVSIGVIGASAIVLGRDFEQGVKRAYSIQNNLSQYQLSTQHTGTPDEHLVQTLNLLNSLQESSTTKNLKTDIIHLLSFYSQKSQQKSVVVYQQALKAILLPEIKNYLGYYLDNPVNQNTDFVYAALKAYLMLGDAKHFQADYISNTLQEILPKSFNETQLTQLINHINIALKTTWTPLPLDPAIIDDTRQFFGAMRELQMAFIILKNINNNNTESQINLPLNVRNTPIFISQQIPHPIPTIFTGKAFSNVLSQGVVVAAQETMLGNWVLGENYSAAKNPQLTPVLIDQLRSTYVSKYVDLWESLLANIHLSNPTNLNEVNNLLSNLIGGESPLLRLLQTLHDNTYFEPIISTSPRLQSLGSLIEKTNPSESLYQIFAGLTALQQYLQPIINSNNEGKVAFETVSARMQNHGTLDAITQLRVIAAKSPDPLKTWLEKIANDTWAFLMQDAGRYIDTSWNDQVVRYYQTEIANRYPFNANGSNDVDIKSFVNFFGNPGIVLNFFNQNLQQLVDTSGLDWHWKTIDNSIQPFSDETLRQIQYAMRIHQTFFPNNDNKLAFQFALQAYKFGDQIQSVKFMMNDKQFIDQKVIMKNPHLILWPSNNDLQKTSVQLTMNNQHIINRDFAGDWGWFKLINESFDSIVTKKAMLINLALGSGQPAKYLLTTDGQFNPFVSLNLRHFHLSPQLTKS